MAVLFYIYVIAAFLVADSYQSSFLNCDGQPIAKSVDIVGCNSLPCPFKKGSYAEAAISFEVTEDSNTLRPVVDVDVGGAHIKYPLPEQNACKGLVSGHCPLQKGQTVTYHLKMPIEKIYPKVALTIQLALVDQNNKSQVCIKIPAKVVD